MCHHLHALLPVTRQDYNKWCSIDAEMLTALYRTDCRKAEDTISSMLRHTFAMCKTGSLNSKIVLQIEAITANLLISANKGESGQLQCSVGVAHFTVHCHNALVLTAMLACRPHRAKYPVDACNAQRQVCTWAQCF